jgi:hypothetical protein
LLSAQSPLDLGTTIALTGDRSNKFMPRFLNAALLGAALIIPVAMAPTALRAQDNKARTYHDKEHNDDHQSLRRPAED